MKKWLTAALVLAMFMSPMEPIITAAGAESAGEVVAAPVEEAVPEAEFSFAGDLELPADGPEEAEAPEEVAEMELPHDGSDETSDDETEYVVSNGTDFTVTGALDGLVVGNSCALTVVDSTGSAVSRDEVTFASTNADVVSVDSRGVVTANGVGSADIRVAYRGMVQYNAVMVPDEPDAIVINVPKTIGLNETVESPEVTMVPEGTAASVTWKSSNEKYVKVDSATGAVRGVKKGSATIVATTRNGKTASCKVTVGKAPTKVTLSLSSSTLGSGGTALAIPAVNTGATCSTYTYQSSDPSVAVVDDAGRITGVGSGKATITVRTYNGKTASATVKVSGAPARLAFPSDSVSVGIGRSAALAPVAYDAYGNVTGASLTYAIEGSCAAIDAATGRVTGLSLGTAVAWATTSNGITATCVVNVVSAPSSVDMSADSLTLGVKEAYDGLRVMLTMPDGTRSEDTSAVWSTDKPKVVSVDEDTGELVGLKKGTARVTADTSWGVSVTCRVTVAKAPSKLTLTPDALTLAVGMSEALTPAFSKNAGCTVSYATSDASVAVVDEDGVVTAVGEGSATIVGRTFNGKSASCKVTVSGMPAAIRLEQTSLTIGQGQSAEVSAEVTTRTGVKVSGGATYYIDSSSPNPGCIRLNTATGEITALSEGEALVGARTSNGLYADRLCAVTVLAAPVAVIFPTTATIGLKETTPALPVQVRFSNGTVADATDVTWSSSKPKVVTVDKVTGELYGLKKGTSTITVTTYNGKTASCKVTVSNTPATLTMSPSVLKLAAGGMKFALQTTSSGTVTYTSSKPEVATVSASGVITTVSKGRTTITASTGSLTAECALTVTDVPAKASFASSNVTIGLSESVTPQVSVLARDGSEAMADLSFSILSGSQYITLDKTTGEITGVRTGVAVVSAETHNGVSFSNTCTVTVKSISPSPYDDDDVEPLDDMTLSLAVGEESGALAEAVGSTPVDWSSTKAKVASVDDYGYVTALSTGTATITATRGSTTILKCSVKVSKAPTSVSISPKDATLTVGSTGQYTVTLSSKAGGSYTFTSSKPSVASITQDGTVTAIKAGTATITVTTYNGISASTTLTVKKYEDEDDVITVRPDVDVPKEMAKLGVASYQDYYTEDMSNALKLEYVIYVGQGQLGMPYIYGGGYNDPNPSGFDCSGFVYWCFKHIGIKLGDSAYKQGYDSRFTKISSISDLKRGDVVCFNTSDDDDLSDHTGIYLGKGYFIHASSGSSKMKVLVQSFKGDSISGDYYSRNFSWGRRILE